MNKYINNTYRFKYRGTREQHLEIIEERRQIIILIKSLSFYHVFFFLITGYLRYFRGDKRELVPPLNAIHFLMHS